MHFGIRNILSAGLCLKILSPKITSVSQAVGILFHRWSVFTRYKNYYQNMLDYDFTNQQAASFNRFYFETLRHQISRCKSDKKHLSIFLVGCMRSGTTVFAKTLATHPSVIWLQGELYDVWQYLGGAPCGINGQRCARLSDEGPAASAKKNMNDYFQWVMSRTKDSRKTCLLNKNPHLINKIAYVRAIFPEAKFLFLIRNIYAQSHSLLRMLVNQHYLQRKLHAYWPRHADGDCWQFIPQHNLPESFSDRILPTVEGQVAENFRFIPQAWITLNATGLRDIMQLEPKSRFLVIYEDLIANPARVLSNVFTHLGIESSDATIARSIAMIRSNPVSYPSKDPLNGWQTGLNQAQKDTIRSTIRTFNSEFEFIARTLGKLSKIGVMSDGCWHAQDQC